MACTASEKITRICGFDRDPSPRILQGEIAVASLLSNVFRSF